MLTNEDNENFRTIVDSLKKSRKEPIIDERTGDIVNHLLYVDPFLDEHLLKEARRPRTAFIEGRRGTGKSTLLQKLQAELRRERRAVALYVDAKRVVIDAGLQNQALNETADGQFARKIALFSAFMPLFVRELKKELLRKNQKGGQAAKAIHAQLEALVDINHYINELDITSGNTAITTTRTQSTQDHHRGGGIAVGLHSARLSGSASAHSGSLDERATLNEGRNVMRTFRFGQFIDDLRDILSRYNINNVYVFVDDFSELDDASASAFMSEIIHPLEVATDELFTFKIAVYPGRYQIEPLERTRVEFIPLDPYQMYSRRTGPGMEASAIDYLGRLLGRRFEYFSKSTPMERFFAAPIDEVCKLLFQISFCNPRILGWVLAFAAEEKFDANRPISLADIKGGAKKYFGRIVEPKVSDRRVFSAAEGDRDQIYVATAVLEAVVSEAKRLRDYKESAFFGAIEGPNPTSHFYCDPKVETLLLFLLDHQLLNFYREASDKDGKTVFIFALDYGLCETKGILFGKPGTGTDKDYWVQRVFGYGEKIKEVCSKLEIYRCKKCRKTQSVLNEDTLRMFGFACPACRDGTVVRELVAVPEEIAIPASMVPKLSSDEFNILTVLRGASEKLTAREIGPAIDITSYYVGKLAKRLVEAGYVNRTRPFAGAAFKYELTPAGRDRFFEAAA